MRMDDAMRVVRRLVWVPDLDRRQIAAIGVVCNAPESQRTVASAVEAAPIAPEDQLLVE